MRRISIHLTAIWFFATLVVVGGIGGIVRGCERDDRSKAIVAQMNERCILLGAEGNVQDPLCGAGPFFGKVKERLAEPRYGVTNVTELFSLAENLKKSWPGALAVIDQSKGWEPIRALADDAFFAGAQEASKKYPLDDMLAGKARPSESFRIEPELRFWEWRFWRWIYLIASAIFVAGFGLTAFLGENKHPVTQYPWRRVDALLMFLAASPASVPAVALYGSYRLFTGEWTRAWGAVRRVFLTVGYQLRIVRKLPAPVIAPAAYHGIAQAPVRPAQAETAALADIQWYVVDRGSFLGIEHLLADAGVEVYPIALRAPKDLKGFAVAAERLAKFEEVLGPLAANPTDQETDVERTVLRTYEPALGAVRIEKMESNANQGRMCWIARAVCARAGGISLMVNSPDEAAQPPEGQDRDATVVTLLHCATPAPAARKTVVRRLYGKDLENPIEGIEPDPNHGIIIRDPDGTPVAQVVGSVVYTLLYGMLTLGTDWALETLARVIHEAVAACLAQEPEEEADDDAKVSAWRSTLDAQRKGYVDLCFGRFEAKQRKLKEAVAECEKTVVEAGETIRKALASKKKKVSELDAFLAKEWPEERERLGTEFDQLAASPYVISVEAGENGIDVFTKTIHVDWRGKRYRIGRFQVTLGDGGTIDIANVANTARGTRYEHPHIRDRRATCWGNMHGAVMELMAERQYAVVITMIYRFLESYNPHSGVADIGHWKEENDA